MEMRAAVTWLNSAESSEEEQEQTSKLQRQAARGHAGRLTEMFTCLEELREDV